MGNIRSYGMAREASRAWPGLNRVIPLFLNGHSRRVPRLAQPCIVRKGLRISSLLPAAAPIFDRHWRPAGGGSQFEKQRPSGLYRAVPLALRAEIHRGQSKHRQDRERTPPLGKHKSGSVGWAGAISHPKGPLNLACRLPSRKYLRKRVSWRERLTIYKRGCKHWSAIDGFYPNGYPIDEETASGASRSRFLLRLAKKTGASDVPHPLWLCWMARGKSTIPPVVVRGPAGQSH